MPKSERHPDPQTFNGDKKDLARFISQLHNKLRMNADRYPTEEQRVGYAFGRLEGPAAAAMEGFWSSGACMIHSLVDFTEHLERLYGNPYKAAHAANEWALLRQGNDRFTEFIAKFERLSATAEIDDEKRKKQQLALAINNRLRHELVPVNTASQDYVSYRQTCLEIESKLEEANVLDALSKVRAPPPKYYAPGYPQPSVPKTGSPTLPRNPPRLLSSGPTPATGANSLPITSRTTTQGGEAMDLTRARGPLTNEEKQYRRDHRLCLYCGEPGHIAAYCTHKVSRVHEIELEPQDPSGNA